MGVIRKSNWKFWLGIVIGLVFLYLAFSGQDFNEIGKSLGQANYWWLIPGLASYFVGVFIRAIRWHYLLGPIQKVPTRRLFPVVVIGYMANNVLPVRMERSCAPMCWTAARVSARPLPWRPSWSSASWTV